MQRDSARRFLQCRTCAPNIFYLITELSDSSRRCWESRLTMVRHSKTFGLFLPTAMCIYSAHTSCMTLNYKTFGHVARRGSGYSISYAMWMLFGLNHPIFRLVTYLHNHWQKEVRSQAVTLFTQRTAGLQRFYWVVHFTREMNLRWHKSKQK